MRTFILYDGDDDTLPKDHWALNMSKSLYCFDCHCMLHASYNEQMKSWVEITKGEAICLNCFYRRYHQ